LSPRRGSSILYEANLVKLEWYLIRYFDALVGVALSYYKGKFGMLNENRQKRPGLAQLVTLFMNTKTKFTNKDTNTRRHSTRRELPVCLISPAANAAWLEVEVQPRV
jgi:hypothetical protein